MINLVIGWCKSLISDLLNFKFDKVIQWSPACQGFFLSLLYLYLVNRSRQHITISCPTPSLLELPWWLSEVSLCHLHWVHMVWQRLCHVLRIMSKTTLAPIVQAVCISYWIEPGWKVKPEDKVSIYQYQWITKPIWNMACIQKVDNINLTELSETGSWVL